jgi:acetyl-CoA carboxylase carboxyl transferase subunit alpha
VPEPLGGAHRDKRAAMFVVGDAIEAALNPLLARGPAELKQHRREKFLAMGTQGL